MYSFHNDIAIPLEMIARKQFGYTDRPRGTIFDADFIESSTFVEVMVLVLRAKCDYFGNFEVGSFIVRCKNYWNVSGNDIPENEAKIIYQEFESLLKTTEPPQI